MNTRWLAVVIAATGWVAGSSAQAQVKTHSIVVAPHPYSTHPYHHHGEFGHHRHFPIAVRPFYGTYPYAGVIRAQGEFNLLTSQAAINLQEARARSIENHQRKVETFFALRAINQQHREQERLARRTNRNERPSTQLSSKSQRHAGLDPTQWDPIRGTLAWPAGLGDERFAAQRERIDELLRLLAVAGQQERADIVAEVDELAQTLRAGLDSQIDELRPMDWIAAKQFLDRVGAEVRLPSRSTVLASW